MHRIIRLFVVPALILVLGSNLLLAQSGSSGTFEFLNLTNSARVASIGSNFLPVRDNDVTIALSNPSVITSDMNNNLAFSFVNYMAANYGYVMFAHSFSKAGNFAGALQFVSYGNFTQADASGTITGTFSASEYALNIGWGRPLSPHFNIGANAKLIYSALESYRSFGIAVDVAGTYTATDDVFNASLIFRNIGYQIVPYTAGNHEPLPFQIQLGLSEKLKHIPLRFYELFTDLQKWDLSYTDPNNPSNQADPITGQTQSKSGISQFADNLMRHIVLGTELTIAKVFSIRLGYNYRERQEMKLYSKAGLAGFSLGFGLRIKMFNISYTRASMQAGGHNPNYFTVGVNLSEFTKKK
ncbi:MAG: type IX secretion system protein PorQ [Bacteroidetes bacterium]|nr:type IX secretion system protein PorQ [Bacteroidota bacterium]